MIRGVTIVILTIFTAAIYMLIAGPVMEGVGGTVTDHDVSNVEGESTIEAMYAAMFQWVPLVLIAGMILYGIAWMLREERYTGGNGGFGP